MPDQVRHDEGTLDSQDRLVQVDITPALSRRYHIEITYTFVACKKVRNKIASKCYEEIEKILNLEMNMKLLPVFKR